MRSIPTLIVLAALVAAGCDAASRTTPPTQGTGTDASAANPFGVPTSVRLPMPASVISTGGGNVISTGGGNYAVQAENEPLSLKKAIRDNVGVYLGSTTLVDAILKGVAQARLLPGREVTFKDDKKGEEFTLLLEVFKDHALISIGRGKAAKGENQIIGISYTSPKKGTAVFRGVPPDPELGKFYLATTYDLEAGKASADAVADTTVISPSGMLLRGHWEFQSFKNEASGKTFAMQAAAFLAPPSKPADSGVYAVTANFLKDHSAAAIVGVQNAATGSSFLFVPNDGISWAQTPPAPHDYYLSGSGQDTPSSSADGKLKAILPADSEIVSPLPTDPREGDPFADPRFTFPQ